MDKRALTERAICSNYITPSLEAKGWNPLTQIRQEVSFTKGRVVVRGKVVARGEAKRADYVLYHKPNIPLAIVEAKDNTHSIGSGMQQALAYGETLDVPYVFSSNGDGFLFHDRTGRSSPIERELLLSEFPSPEELWTRYTEWKSLGENARLLEQDYYSDAGGKSPRYYQQIAINRTVEAFARGQKRILLVLATGTGKTYVAFQVIWRLWKARRVKRVLFLADRNILVDQTKTNDFKPFGAAMTKITHRRIDKSYEIYLALYQGVTGPDESDEVFRQFSPDFFDLIIVDECHRGSATEDSAWRSILEYFDSATQIGLTATPKETRDGSNTDYFGKALYSYSLRQGIGDGFLAPYKVVRIDLDKDLAGWRPESGQRDKHGTEIEDRIYGQADFDRALVLEERTKQVAASISEFLRETDRFSKTIVFCEDIDHAERLRSQLVSANADLASANPRYVMRITGDNEEGKAQLDNFIDPESRYPVIATTSRLLTTGVDVQTCKVIVLDRSIKSLPEFKQIIGRGTRINEEYGKFFFTIIDFRRATELFADPEFDGEPFQLYEPRAGESIAPPEDAEGEYPAVTAPTVRGDEALTTREGQTARTKYVVDGVPVTVVAKRVQYYGADGSLITESLKAYTKKAVLSEYASLDAFLTEWTSAERKGAIVKALADRGVLWDALEDEIGREYDAFDLICHVAFDKHPLSRRDRAERVKRRNYLAEYSRDAQAVLAVLLDKYADEGLASLETLDVLRVQPLTDLGTPVEIINRFGSREKYLAAILGLEQQLYAA